MLSPAAAATTGPASASGHLQDHVAGAHEAGAVREREHPLDVGDDDLGEQALGAGCEDLGIELDQRIAGAHEVPVLHLWPEAFALERDGLQADVHQHFEAAGRLERDRVVRGVKAPHDTVAGRAQTIRDGIDRDTLADHLGGEDRVGDLGEGDQRSAHGGSQCEAHGSGGV